MSLHIIIDGYNLIRQSAYLSPLDDRSIQTGRDALISMLATYRQIRHHRITVVFDGSGATSGSLSRDRIQGISVVFSRRGELADAVIKRMAETEKEKAVIVSSDQDIVRYSASVGCTTLGSPVFENKLMLASQQLLDEPNEDIPDGWIPTTRKKGPSRRLSKRERQNRLKTFKL